MSGFRRGFAVLAGGNLLGKLVALAREIVFAGAFGVGSVASGFRVAQTASIVPANLVAGDLLSAAFAPSYALECKRDPRKAASQLWGYSIWLTTLLIAVALLVFVGREAIVTWIVPGGGSEIRNQAAVLLGILCWTMPLYGLSAVLSYALGAHGRYAATSLRPLIQSVGLLLGTFLAILTGWIPWLAVGFVSAWAVYTAFNIAFVVRSGLLPTPRVGDLLSSWVFLVDGARLVAPLFVLTFAIQVSIIAERAFASFGEPGLIAAVDYARTVSDSVMSLVAVPLGVLGLTKLSALTSERYSSAVSTMTSVVVAAMLPVSAIVAVSALPIVTALYARGQFDAEAARLTSQVLTGLSLGLAFQVLGYSLSRALTANGKNSAVLKYTSIALVGQVSVQGIGIITIGSLAIGLGPSVFGVLLTVGCAHALGVLGKVGLQCLAATPAILVTAIALVVADNYLVSIAIVLAAWTANTLAAPILRRPLAEQVGPMWRWLKARFRKNSGH